MPTRSSVPMGSMPTSWRGCSEPRVEWGDSTECDCVPWGDLSGRCGVGRQHKCQAMDLEHPHAVDLVAETQLQELGKNGNTSKQRLYRMCRDIGPGSHPLKTVSPGIGSPSLLDRVQERPDVKGSLRQLRRRRLMERGMAVYIPPQAKVGLQASDEARFSLMEKVDEFLHSDQTVFLLLGDTGTGKSTFNRELECRL
ncbi:MAG: hypothetical protein J3Q66DRAFT_140968 [Benniella sp.]|nr:MAG: hypothetical protein J3Q66DRAFT_140968 [Benniella sp.]